MVTGIDSGMGPAERHGNVWRAVGEMADAGFPVAEALAAATSVAADACGLAGEAGRLVEGYTADVLIVDGDPRLRHLGVEQPAGDRHPGDAGGARPKPLR